MTPIHKALVASQLANLGRYAALLGDIAGVVGFVIDLRWKAAREIGIEIVGERLVEIRLRTTAKKKRLPSMAFLLDLEEALILTDQLASEATVAVAEAPDDVVPVLVLDQYGIAAVALVEFDESN